MKLTTMGALSLGALLSLALLPASQAQNSDTDDTSEARQGFRRGPMAEGRMGGMRGRMAQGQLRQMRGAADPQQMLERLDTDGDGSISEEEFLAQQSERLAAQFDRRDRDGDGLLSADESAATERGQRPPPGAGPRGGRAGPPPEAVQACLQAAAPGQREPRPEREDLLAAADSNGDGAISLDELTSVRNEQALQRFANLDSDGDGFITDGDLQARQDQLQARRAELRSCLQSARDETN